MTSNAEYLTLNNQLAVIVGGGSGIGLAVAKAAVKAGARVVIAGRSAAKLEAARASIGPMAAIRVFDQTDADAVASAFADIGEIDHLIVTASAVRTGPVRTLPIEQAVASMNSKFWGQYFCARSAQVRPSGSITLFSGVLSRKPALGLASLGAINAAVEGLGRGLAMELAPVRVNVVSPGLTDTGIYDGIPTDRRHAFFDGTAKTLPVGRIGRPEDIAAAVVMLMVNGFITGTTIDVDGGSMLGSVMPH